MRTFKREYFYYFNERGQLFHIFDIDGFLAVKLPRQIPSGPIFLRDPKFLNFIWRNLKVTEKCLKPRSVEGEGENGGLISHRKSFADATFKAFPSIEKAFAGRDVHTLFPFVSHCGGEGNYLAVQDAPVVFHDLEFGRTIDELSENDASMVFAGSLREPFSVSALRVGCEGRLYHPVTTLPHLASSSRSVDEEVGSSCLGLVGSNVAIKLGLEYFCEDTDEHGNYNILWRGQKHVVPFLPSSSECWK